MKTHQTAVLLTFVVVSVVLGAVTVYAYAYNIANTSPNSPNTAAYGSGNYSNQMMNGYGMMGNGGMMSGWQNNEAPYVPNIAPQNTAPTVLGLTALVGSVITGTGGLAYFLLIAKRKATPNVEGHFEKLPQAAEAPYASVSKTLTAEEKQVLDVLVSHDGKYLQKYIRAETGLSRLKTHRIVTRLAERGIVALETLGNTNEVRLSSWLKNPQWSGQKITGSSETTSVSL